MMGDKIKLDHANQALISILSEGRFDLLDDSLLASLSEDLKTTIKLAYRVGRINATVECNERLRNAQISTK